MFFQRFLLTTLICLYTGLYSHIAYGKHDQLIFFGDSLTDTGNFPTPSNVNHYNLMHFNYFVPISNLVLPQHIQLRHDLLPDKLHSTVLTEDFLERSLVQAQNTGNLQSKMFTMTWAIPLAYYLNGNPVYPSNKLNDLHIKVGLHPNINYACSAAVTGMQDYGRQQSGYFATSKYPDQPIALTKEELAANHQKYKENTSKNLDFDSDNNYKYPSIRVPDLTTQIDSYLQDTQHSPNNNTSFFIFIGANDIGWIMSQWLAPISVCFNASSDQRLDFIINHIERAIRKIKQAYAEKNSTGNYTIHLLTLHNLTYSPRFHQQLNHPSLAPIKYLFGAQITQYLVSLCSRFNEKLRETFQESPHVKILETGELLDTLANSNAYRANMGKAYISYLLEIEKPYLASEPFIRNEANRPSYYLYFNQSHLTSAAYIELANFVAEQIKTSQ